MSKRLMDTNKYRKPFLRSLQAPYKLLWDYICLDCDHAGIWIVDFEVAQLYIGNDAPINKTDALEYFNSDEIRIVELDNDKKWFIPSFIEFQYGELNPQNRVHNSVISLLNKYNLLNENKPLIRPLQGVKDKDIDKVKDKDKEKEAELEKSFLIFWNLYDKKVSREKCLSKFKKLSQKDIDKIFETLPNYVKSTERDNGKFRKNPETYLNNKSWNDEIINYTNNGNQNGNFKSGTNQVQNRTTSDIKRTLTTDDIQKGIDNLYQNGF